MKVKYLAQKHSRINYCFSSIVSYDYHYDYIWGVKHNIILKYDEQQELLYNGKPCVYTDNNYDADYSQFANNINLTTKKRFVSLKTVIRKINDYKNLTNEVITLKALNRLHYTTLKISLDVILKIKPSNEKVVFNKTKTFTDTSIIRDEKVKSIIDILIELGFSVFRELHDENYDGTIFTDFFVVFGANKKIGISQFDETIYGYNNSINNILYDELDYFNKWSSCEEIPKSNSVMDIINEIIGNNKEMMTKKRKLILKKYKQ